jgi:hypothetical protein
MRHVPELIILLAIVLGLVGGGATYYVWQNLWISFGTAFGTLFSSAFLLNRLASL